MTHPDPLEFDSEDRSTWSPHVKDELEKGATRDRLLNDAIIGDARRIPIAGEATQERKRITRAQEFNNSLRTHYPDAMTRVDESYRLGNVVPSVRHGRRINEPEGPQ